MAGEDSTADKDPVSAPEGIAEHQHSRGDVPGAPTWPTVDAQDAGGRSVPPVGLNWSLVADKLRVKRGILEHEGSIVLAGEYFPEAGYVIDPTTLEARFVDVGEVALRPGYFLGELAIRHFRVALPIQPDSTALRHPVIPKASTGPIIGLFADESDARQAKQRILRGSLGSGVRLENGPLGVELRAQKCRLGGAVATVIASHGGAVISIGGDSVTPSKDGSGHMATGEPLVHEGADTSRSGLGATTSTQSGAQEPGSSRGQ